MKAEAKKGFTLVEVLIVVLILGLLAAVVIISINNASTDARQNTFVTNIKSFVNAAEYYRYKTGEFIESADPGQVPVGWEEFIEARKWTKHTPIGGQWHVADLDVPAGFTSCIGIGVTFDGSGETRDEEFMGQIDAKFDDGDLADGIFQQTGSGYYYIIAL